ncbi:MAG TPA: hypothetical protein VMS14_11255, partial [Ilumatobacteraceae bacterium]|nr:hypothetical protein [Ilumatobacteraceae bacterium]
MNRALDDAVNSFVAAASDELAGLTGRDATSFRTEVTVEAANIVGGVLAADGRLTDGELDAYLDVLGPQLDPPLTVSTAAAREMQLFNGATARLGTASVLFDLLCKADARHGTRRTHSYYEAAMRLAHESAALDLVPSPGELAAIDSLRSALLVHLDGAGVPRPGTPLPVTPASPAPAIEAPPVRPITELLAELDALVGLANVKAEVRRLTSLLQVQ